MSLDNDSTSAAADADGVRAALSRGVIDTHVHTWNQRSPWMAWLAGRPDSWAAVRQDFPWTRLRSELDAARVAELILVQAGTSIEETHALLQLAEHEPSVLGVVGWVGMSSPQVTERDLTALAAAGTKLVGVRALHRWEPDGEVLADPAVIDSVRVLADRGVPLDLFVNDHTELALLPPIIEAVPHGRYVIDHLGRPPIDGDATARRIWATSMTRLAGLPNVFVKYSGWATTVGRVLASDVAAFGHHVLSSFGAERTMFASNWPVALTAGSYHDTFAATLESLSWLPPEELDDVLAGTARRCYLTPRPATGGQR